uniref:hypothetical protein n=1 Tax=Methanobrevibacter sp. TaxID=66852 RepID=UPI00388FDE76
NCTFSNNVANCGGAIYNQGLLTVENCSFYSNYVEGSFLNSIGITTGGVGVDICNLEGVGNVYAAQKIDYDEVKDLDAMQTTAMVVTTAAVSFVVGAGAGYLTGSIKAGAVAGAAVGACIGAIGSLLVCYNTMDVTFNDLQFSLLLIGGSMVAGAIGGAFGGYFAQGQIQAPVQIPEEPIHHGRIVEFNGHNLEIISGGSELTADQQQIILDRLLTHAPNANKLIIANNNGYLIVKPLFDGYQFAHFEILM